MSQQNGAAGYVSYGAGQDMEGLRSEGRQPGSRRAKLRGYLKAANELRQEFMSNYSAGWDSRDSRAEYHDDGSPNGYPQTAVIEDGDEGMILFPSYAIMHIKKKKTLEPPPSTLQEPGAPAPTDDQEVWKQNWEEYEEDNAVVDVDVRGWVFAPHKGPMNRKQRFYLSLARQLAGLPSNAPRTPGASGPNSRETSPDASQRVPARDNAEETNTKIEAEVVSKVAERIQRQGEAEAEVAGRGGYSEASRNAADGSSARRMASSEQSPMQDSSNDLRQLAARNSSVQGDDDSSLTSKMKRASWPLPAKMNPDQLSLANAHLLARMRPFLSTPIANAPISAFFYNDKLSRQRTIYTNASGQFALRAALDFVPTHVRILASEKLSATEEVIVTESQGVTVVSDIDDTVKHTSMLSGAREAFRNAFIRELADLTIEGVKEWYCRLFELGVKFHYVSNSPWQLYPTLSKYMSVAGLPPGSVHLKLYSGMLQGIFEPVAERKKSTMDRLARDFPERKFILVGDSGEADLEVYTDFMVEHPGRVLAVFIRDVTTSLTSTGFFDGSMGPLNGDRRNDPRRSAASDSHTSNAISGSINLDHDPDLEAAIEASLRDLTLEEKRNRPPLPARKPLNSTALKAHSSTENLIDFSDDDLAPTADIQRLPRSMTDPTLAAGPDSPADARKNVPPTPPKKPLNLRRSSQQSGVESAGEGLDAMGPTESSEKKQPPPKPRRPSTTVNPAQPWKPSPLANMRLAQTDPVHVITKPQPPAQQSSYAASAMQKLSNAYNMLPPAPSIWSYANRTGADGEARTMSSSQGKPPPPPPPRRSRGTETGDKKKPPAEETNAEPRPALPPRTGVASYPAAAAQYASSRVSSAWNAYNNPSGPADQGYHGSPSPSVNKREEMWRRRWATAEDLCKQHGVLLRSWRVGTDVADECVKLVEEALKNIKVEEGKREVSGSTNNGA